MEWEKHIKFVLVFGTIVMVLFAIISIVLTVLYFKRVNRLKQEEDERMLQARIEAEHSERKRIADFMYDILCNDIFAVHLYLGSLEKCVTDPYHLKNLKRAQEIQKDILEKARDVAYDTLPPALGNDRLDMFLSGYIHRLKQFSEVRLHFNCPEQLPVFELSFSYEVYRVIQQLVRNALEHGQVTELLLGAYIDEGYLVIELLDDGIEFDIHELYKTTTGLGIKTVFSRLKNLGGTLKLLRLEDGGNRLTIKFKMP